MEGKPEAVLMLETKIENIRLALKTLSQEVDSIERNLRYLTKEQVNTVEDS